MKLKPLLAKPRKYGKELTLEQHLIDTENAAIEIFKGRILENWCRFFRVQDAESFLIHLRIAALFHDVGKANQEFYTSADTNYWGNKQTLRHEWLSALILHLPNVREWLKQNSLNLDLEVITAAVLSHHLKASCEKWGRPRLTGVQTLELYSNHPEITNILEKIGQIANVGNDLLPKLPLKWNDKDVIWQQAYQHANDAGEDFCLDIEEDEDRRSLLLAVKAGVMVADSAASGIFRVESSDAIEQWINTTLHQNPITPEELEDKILQPRYRDIAKKSNKTFKLKPFQQQAEKLGDRLLLLSGCGTGKTIFAYKWMQGVLARYQAGHIIFLYPTRGTATEGFKDYVSWAPEFDASLLTGTAAYELQQIRENPTDSTEEKDYTTEARLYSLGFWGKRFFSATVDQFLSFLTHNYGGICLLPVLADSVIVIDEVHSFSRGMFDKLVSFLEHFDIPVLCMTATLPTTRRTELTKRLQQKIGKGLTIFPTEEDRSQLEELKKAENHPRYIVELTDYETAFQKAIAAYQQGEKQGTRILWVVNTVDSCREVANRLSMELNTEVITYHSRFRLQDRQKRHTETVNAFAYSKGKRTRAIAATTQVCEMSLDLDADILITELAPISALVQRFGRSNRHLSRGDKFLAQVLVYEPEKVLPYKKEQLDKAQDFLAEITREVSQRDLAEKLEAHSPTDERFANGSSPFTSSGYWAIAEKFRESNNYTVSAILDTDLDEVQIRICNNKKAAISISIMLIKLNQYLNALFFMVIYQTIEKYKAIDGFIVPVPKKSKHFLPEPYPKWLPRYLKIANRKFDGKDLYKEKMGFGE
ncbi:MAG: CRISPR-associated helicase Cas3' [Cyanobacteria bacterium P01_F01_bin.143]